MNRLYSIFLWAALAVILIGCGRGEEAPASKVEAPKILNMADGEVREGVVYVKATGQPFAGTLREHWPSGKLRRETK